jgi:membrane protein DedA with SNARE-associated domain
MKRYRRLFLPLSVVGLLIILHILGAYGVIDPPAVLIRSMTERIRSGSLSIVAICSFFEGLAVVNAYFPGGGVILIAMASTAGDVNRAILTFAAIVVGSAVAHQLNYWVGRILGGGRGSESATDETAPTLLEAFASYWHPHTGSMYSLRSGADGISYKRFAFRFLIAFGMWNVFWGVLMYQLGHVPLSSSELLMLFYVYLAWWIAKEVQLIRKSAARLSIRRHERI